MNGKKRKAPEYRVVVWSYMGEPDGFKTYSPKWVCEWPEDPSKWGARFHLSPKQCEALSFGRDTALDVARTVLVRGGMWAMVELA